MPEDDVREAVQHAEQRMLPAVRAAMARYLTVAAAAVLRHDTRPVTAAPGDVDPAELPPSLAAWPPTTAWTAAAIHHILPASAATWVAGWTATLTPDQAAALPEAPSLDEHLADTTARVTAASWPDDVYNQVQAAVTASLAARETLTELRAHIADTLHIDRWSQPAETIARDLALRAYNTGTWRAGLARQQQFGETLHKRWLAANDLRVRPAHHAASGQVVAATEPFQVGGEPLRYPHDPLGSPEATSNCRCVVQWIDEADADAARQRYQRHLDDVNAGDTPTPAALAGAPGRMPGDLRRYWTRGTGAAKIRWGTSGDFDRCRRQLRKYVDNSQLNGLCANLHKSATGDWPGGRKASAGPCPCEELTDDQVEELLATAMAGETTDPEQGTTMGDHQPATATVEPAATGDGDVWAIPTDEEIAAWNLDEHDDDDAGGPQTVTAADFTPSGAPTAVKRRRAESGGKALPGGRFPIENGSDLDKAIAAVGRASGGEAGRRLVRRHIMRQARRLGLTNKIPDTWMADGSLKTASTGRMAAAPGAVSWAERVAANVPMEPDPEAFRTPPMARGTKMHVLNEQGWVAGYIADWDTRHRVHDVPPPRDPYGGRYPKFHRHPIRTADSGQVMTGPIATNGHGDPQETDLWSVMRHYDDPRYVVANVVVTENEHGIWAAGSLRADVTPFQIALLDTYSQSGHWMPGPSGLAEELVASCCVSVPAFELDQDSPVMALAAAAGPDQPRLADPVQHALFDNQGRCVVLVAAGIVTPPAQQLAAAVDPWQLLRSLRHAAAVDRDVQAARRRIVADPAVTAAADRMRGNA